MSGQSRLDAALAQSDRLLECVQLLSPDEDGREDARAERTRLFEIPGVCPPYEAAWVRRDKGAILGDIAGFYKAFGFLATPEHGVRPDHLAAELEFLAVLRVMEAQAVQRNDDRAADIALEAYVNFLGDHVADWIGPFCAHLKSCTLLDELHRCVDLVEQLWNIDAARYGLAPFDQLGLETMPEDFNASGESPYECLGEGSSPCGASQNDALVPLTTSAAGHSPPLGVPHCT